MQANNRTLFIKNIIENFLFENGRFFNNKDLKRIITEQPNNIKKKHLRNLHNNLSNNFRNLRK